MKKFTTTLFALVASVFLLAGCGENLLPQEGKHFSVLPSDLSKYNLDPVTEVFSLQCGHCRQMEHVIPELEKQTGQSFGKVHVTFNEGAKIGAMIYYTAVMQLDGVPDGKMMDELFAAVQLGDGASLQDRQKAIEQAFISRNLYTPYELNESHQSTLFEHMVVAEGVSVDGRINAVPSFIVDGRYLINTSAHESVEDIARTINYLIKNI